jgi:hypothetical protein
MRRLLVTALAAACLPAAAAHARTADPCEESVRNCDLNTGQVIPMEARTIFAILPPREGADGLYRSLIPTGYTAPEQPAIGVYLTEPNVPRRIPGQPYNEYSRWVEGIVGIKVRREGVDGFFPLAMPVTSRFEYDLGRAAGLPKIMVEGSLEPDGDGFTGRTAVAGKDAVVLEWKPGAVEPSADLREAIRQRFPLFALREPLRGPEIWRTKFTITPELAEPQPAPIPPFLNQPQPEAGLVRVRLADDVDALDDTLPDLFAARGARLSDLVALDSTVPGMVWNIRMNLYLSSQKIGDGGGYGSPPPAAPATARAPVQLPSARGCRSRRRFPLTVTGPKGRPIRSVRVLVDGRRRGTARPDRSRRRAVVDLRGLPRGRYRVTVKVHFADGRSLTLRRSYRTCAS